MSRFARTTAMAAVLLSLGGTAFAQDTATDAAPKADSGKTADAATDANAPSIDTVLATVDGTPITLGHMIALVRELPQQYQALPDATLYDAILNQMIQQTVLSGELTDPSTDEMMQIENQERALKAGIILQRVLAKPISDDELQAAYDANYADAAPETEYHAAHILVKTKEEADAIEEQLKNGGDFAAIAKEKSQDPGSAKNGGDLGWFGTGMMVPEFEKAVTEAKVGEVTAPVQTQFGWHIIKLEETREKDKPTLDDVRDELTQQVKDEKVQAAIDAAMQGADVNKDGADKVDPSAIRMTDLLDQ